MSTKVRIIVALIFPFFICLNRIVQATNLEIIYNKPKTRFTPNGTTQSPIGKRLIELINSSKHSIDFAIYGFRNQPEVLRSLEAAQTRGVKIRGVVDASDKGINYYKDTPQLVSVIKTVVTDYHYEQENRNSDFSAPPWCKRPAGFAGPLQCLGYDVGNGCILSAQASRSKFENLNSIMHNKFFIFDGRIVWTGSSNISDSGTGGYNANVAAVINSQEVADAYRTEFNQMYEKTLFHKSKQTLLPLNTFKVDDSFVTLAFSPQEDPIRSQIEPLVMGAKSSINIAVFYLTHKHITRALIDARRRGVKVRVIIDATSAENGYTKHTILRRAGVPVKVENWGGKMHMKAASFDGKHLVLGSMNWTSAGVYKNDENTLVVESKEHTAKFDSYFESIWNLIDDRYLTDRPYPESVASIGSCTDGMDNNFNDLIDVKDPGCRNSSVKAAALPPITVVPKSEGYGLIKGNIGRGGRRYHLPTSEWYPKTRISPEKGEVWLCSPHDGKLWQKTGRTYTQRTYRNVRSSPEVKAAHYKQLMEKRKSEWAKRSASGNNKVRSSHISKEYSENNTGLSATHSALNTRLRDLTLKPHFESAKLDCESSLKFIYRSIAEHGDQEAAKFVYCIERYIYSQ